MNQLLVLSAALAVSTLAIAQDPPPSPAATTSTTINGKALSIKYSAPSMRGRKIFGELVPYGKVWRAGANEDLAICHFGSALLEVIQESRTDRPDQRKPCLMARFGMSHAHLFAPPVDIVQTECGNLPGP